LPGSKAPGRFGALLKDVLILYRTFALVDPPFEPRFISRAEKRGDRGFVSFTPEISCFIEPKVGLEMVLAEISAEIKWCRTLCYLACFPHVTISRLN
jgi:hypothetical protein